MPEDSVDLDRMLDLATPWCLRVAATLHIPEHIEAGHTDIRDLAAQAGCDQDALHAVLGHLVSQGVFIEESPGRFSCNPAAAQLAGPQPLHRPQRHRRPDGAHVGDPARLRPDR